METVLTMQPKFNQNDLERRPEFAPQQPQPQQPQPPQQAQAGPSRPPTTNQTSNVTKPMESIVPPAPPSPLRTLQEVEMSDFAMTEAFDGEFLDVGGESFFDIVDQGGPTHDAA